MSLRSPGHSIAITSTLRLDPSTPVSTKRKTHPIPDPQPVKTPGSSYSVQYRSPNPSAVPRAALAQASLVGLPVRHLVAGSLDVVATGGIVFVRHGQTG